MLRTYYSSRFQKIHNTFHINSSVIDSYIYIPVQSVSSRNKSTRNRSQKSQTTPPTSVKLHHVLNFPFLLIHGSRENSRATISPPRTITPWENGGEIVEGVDPVLNSRSRLEAEKRIDVSMTKVLIGADL